MTARVRPSLAVWGESLDEWVAAARAAEDAGFAAAWSNELHRTAFVPLAAAAPDTHTIELGSAVALAFVRSPMVTALEALDLDELSGGRLVLGLGTGVQRLVENWHGAVFERPALRLRETVAAIRAVVRQAHLGRPIAEQGELVGLDVRGWRRPVEPVREDIPVFVAAVGPVMTRTAGEIGDGWIAHELGSPGYLREQIVPRLEEGWRRAGRGRAGFTVVASACCAVDSDRATARRMAAATVAFYASVRSYQPFFAWHGFEAEAVRVQELFRAEDREAMVDAVTDEMVDALCLAGTPDDVRAGLRRYDGLADVVKLGPPVHLDDPAATRLAQKALLEACA